MISSPAAVLHNPGEPLHIETIEVMGPGPGEALVEIAATGLCHTDTTTFDGNNPSCVYPAILGHEGAGHVVDVGPDVAGLAPGDHVIPLYGPECGTCAMCRSQRTNLCWSIKATRDRGVLPDGTSRFRLGGDPVYHFMGTSTLSQYTVVPEIALARIRPDAPSDSVCLLGCSVTTGVGAALNDVHTGDVVTVFGLGGIGINVIQGARIAGASRIIGIDTNADKQPLAEKYGMTDFIDAAHVDDVPSAVHDLTSGGTDTAFECTGHIPVMRQAADSCHVGWGTCVLLGVEPAGTELSLPPVLARYGRTIKGSYFGGIKGRSELNLFVDLYLDGHLDIDSQITHRGPLTDVNEGFQRMARGTGIRTILTYK